MHGASDVVLLKSVNGSDVLVGKLKVEALEVALDAVGSQTLGQDNVALGSAPVEKDLSRSLAILFSDGTDGRVMELVTPGQPGGSSATP